MAIVTPVEEEFLKGANMKHTMSYAIGQFKQRASTTLQFMRQIRRDENVVRTWRRKSPRHRMKSDVFEERFNVLNFPSIYRKMAVGYRDRLEGLRGNPMGLAEVMTDRDWTQLLFHNEILKIEPSETDVPLTAIISPDRPEQTPPAER
jgi:hypothetical protein